MAQNLDLLFKNTQRIITLTDKEKISFKQLVEIVQIKKNAFLLRQGQICDYEYFILEGCLRSFYEDNECIEHTTLIAIESWWTGDLKSFVRKTPSEFNVQALEDSTIVRISRENMEEIYRQIPKFERYFRILLQNRLLATQDRVGEHLSESAMDRYSRFVAQNPSIEQRIAAKHIASYLGITPTYLSRLRKKRLAGYF